MSCGNPFEPVDRFPFIIRFDLLLIERQENPACHFVFERKARVLAAIEFCVEEGVLEDPDAFHIIRCAEHERTERSEELR